MNNPPTALVGFGEQRDGLFCRLRMNDPPTALVGFGEQRDGLFCRLSMNDPPNALVVALLTQGFTATVSVTATRCCPLL
jgi:hypothetical protein